MTRVHLSSMMQTAGRQYCFLYLLSQTDLVDLTDHAAMYHADKKSAGADSWLAPECQLTPCFYIVCKAFTVDMKTESYEQSIWEVR